MSKSFKFPQNGQKLDFGHPFPISEYVVISVCVLGFLSGLSMCTSGGYYMFTLIDDKSASWNLLLVAFLEVILVGWIYGADRFLDNIKEMDMNLGPFFHWYWKICWQFITPGIMVILIMFSFINHAPTYVDITHRYIFFEICIFFKIHIFSKFTFF